MVLNWHYFLTKPPADEDYKSLLLTSAIILEEYRLGYGIKIVNVACHSLIGNSCLNPKNSALCLLLNVDCKMNTGTLMASQQFCKVSLTFAALL